MSEFQEQAKEKEEIGDTLMIHDNSRTVHHDHEKHFYDWQNDDEEDEEEDLSRMIHWRNTWNFHQKVDDKEKEAFNEKDDDYKEVEDQEIYQRCLNENIEIVSPNESNLHEFLDEVIELLQENYVEDPDGTFTFSYTPNHIKWIMLSTHDHLDLLIGLRDSLTNQLIGFLAATPVTLHVLPDDQDPAQTQDQVQAQDQDSSKQNTLKQAGLIDFVCIHKNHRGKRFCPFLYQIITNRFKHFKKIDILIKTSGTELQYPLTSIYYHHLTLNHDRCVQSGFSSSMIPPSNRYRKNAIEKGISTSSMIPLEERHLDSLLLLLQEEAKKSQIGLYFPNKEFVFHLFLQFPEIIHAYVKESIENSNEVTDFISFYVLPFKINSPGNPLHEEYLKTCYYFYSSGKTFSSTELLQMIALIACDEFQIDVLNILPIGPIKQFDCRMIGAGIGTGALQYYLTSSAGIHRKLLAREIFIFPGV